MKLLELETVNIYSLIFIFQLYNDYTNVYMNTLPL